MMSADKIGRSKRGFDKKAAVAAALHEFWSRGFEGVSMEDLTNAMGVSRPTLYAVFGGKEELFHHALDYYSREQAAFYHEAGKAPTAKGVAQVLLRGALKLFAGGSNPPGCLYVTHLVARGSEMDTLRAEMKAGARIGEAALQQRFKRAVLEGDLRPGTDPAGLAHMLMALVQGLAVQASSGAPRDMMERMVETALAAWPTVEPDRAEIARTSIASPRKARKRK
jgi:AcrR family transcriptional regulator